MTKVPERPIADPKVVDALRDMADSLDRAFRAAGCQSVDSPILQPADEIIDLLGENVRRRVFMCADAAGEELCLRPDLTIPTCRYYLNGLDPSAPPASQTRLSYCGPGFRRAPSGEARAREFTQAGFELLGPEDALKADLETFKLTYDVCVGAGFTGPQLRFGDLGLFTALLDALPLSEAWRHKLKRNYWRPDYFSNLVGQLADPALQREAVLGKVLSKLDPEEAQKVVADLLTLSEVEAVGSRTLDEITERLVSQAIETATDPLADDQVTLINAFLKVEGPPLEALSEVADLVQSGGVNVSSALDLARTRFERIGALGVDLAAARFSTTFGRHLEYYTGFVFELNEPRLGSEGQVAGGGRYDRLLETMGAPWPVSASGAAIRVERLFGAAALAGGQGA